MIEVILREDVKSLGKAGELVRVKPGYARNFLLPQGLAFEATEGNKKRIAAETRARGVRDQADRVEAERFAATLGAVTLTLSGKAGEEGKLFGSITAQDIADALAGQGHQVDRRRIELQHAIKSLGQHTVEVRLHPEVHAEVRVSVVPE
jgi:large subunit ribosomal protein L9